MNSNSEHAFAWIVNILKMNGFKFQISGGLAAIAYGSQRELYDIDIDLVSDDILKLSTLKDLQNYIVFGPKRILLCNFDVFLLTLKYNGVLIDLSESFRMFDANLQTWIDDRTDFDAAVSRYVFGIYVPIISLEDLIEYKKILSRKEDIEDLKFIDSSN